MTVTLNALPAVADDTAVMVNPVVGATVMAAEVPSRSVLLAATSV